MENIRNFVIIAHIDHGKSTLADRMLEVTGTIERRKMKAQFLDQLELEQERGITIKMAPVRMCYTHTNRGLTQTQTQTNAEYELLYKEITYEIRGAVFSVKKNIGLGHKESVYQNALEEEFKKRGIAYEKEKTINVLYEDKKIGVYRPDFLIEDKIILEIKALPFVGKTEETQTWNYLKGSDYKLAMLINFGGSDVSFKRMVYDSARFPRESAESQRESAQVEDEYILNLIDTPGHPDFGYEVSRALEAVEGAVLLVDGTQGIQAQTLSNFWAAKKAGLTIIGAVNKVDLNIPDIDRSVLEVAELLEVSPDAVHKISGKTGQGVEELLEDVVRLVPPPTVPKTTTGAAIGEEVSRGLIFDSFYDDHQGIVAGVRVMNGIFKEGDQVALLAVRQSIKAKEVGHFVPRMAASATLQEGEIGYIVTGLKDPNKIKIGDTVIHASRPMADTEKNTLFLPGYREPKPVVFVSFFPDEADEFDDLKKALERLRLNDSAFVFEPDYNEVLGRGFKGGFLGKLHFEIVSQRLEREFDVETVTSFPSVAYKVKTDAVTKSGLEKDGDYVVVKNPADLPVEYDHILEPMIQVEIIAPNTMVGNIIQLQQMFRWQDVTTQNLHDRVVITATMPLAELISDFDDKLKSVSGGFASFSYQEAGYQRSDLTRLDMLVAGEAVPGLSRIVPKDDVERLGRSMAEKLKTTLPQQQFTQAIQAQAMGRIIARETIPAMKKDVTGYLYGGDRTRKMKLWKKQKEGKKKLKAMGRVTITAQDFKKLLEK